MILTVVAQRWRHRFIEQREALVGQVDHLESGVRLPRVSVHPLGDVEGPPAGPRRSDNDCDAHHDGLLEKFDIVDYTQIGQPIKEGTISDRRSYHSPVRRARAADTRERIEAAASRLFIEGGFTQATVASIATAAGVSQPTIYSAYGSKAGLLLALLTRLEERVDGADWADRIRAESDLTRRVTLFAAWSRELYETGTGLIRVANRVRGEPDVAALHAEGDRRRRDALAVTLDHPPTPVIDRAFVLTSPVLYLMCVDDCGWTPDDYQHWLDELLANELERVARS